MFLRDTTAISDREAIVDEFDHKFTYGELDALSAEYEKNIQARSLVLILCDYAIETVAFYYCQMTNHVVPILVDKKIKQEVLLNIIKTYEPEFIWVPRGMENILGAAAEKNWEIGGHVLLKSSFKKCEMDFRLALLLTTSGTTGSIKFVRLSYDNLLHNIQSFGKRVGICEDDRGITVLPMYHCFGLSLLHMQWLAGAAVYVTDCSVLDVKFWNFFAKGKVTNFFGVAYTFEMLKQIGFLEKNYPSLRFIVQGGARMSDERRKEFIEGLQRKKVRLYIGYGQTEATTCISLIYEKVKEKMASVGEPISGIEIAVKNPDDAGVGELVIKGKNVSLGYAFGREDLIRGDDNGGCLYTGDMVYVDTEGDIFIRGRKSRFIKILGERISLDEIEAVLLGHFPGIEFACAGEDDKIAIFYTGIHKEKEILRFFCREFSIPGKLAECYSIKELPRTNTGKVNYAELWK